MFDEYSPVNKRMLSVLSPEGKAIDNALMPQISNEKILKSYKDMLFARTADLMIVSYQRQGRIYTYAPNWGQEAIAGSVAALITKEDWLVPAFREMTTMLAKGVNLKEIFLYYMGNEDGSSFKNAENTLPISIPMASQLLHAVGVGYAIKYNKNDNLVYTMVGDGGTSEGDFHEALNFAGIWKVPVIFVIENNQYAISTPVRMQTASESLAIKSIAYGIKGIQVDGNDFFAMYKVLQEAARMCHAGEGPVLIEAVTYRKGAHTTSDDPTRYRTKEEEESWDEKDPLKRLKLYLIDNGLWSEKEEEHFHAQFSEEVDRLFSETENYGPYPKEAVFKYLYADMPEDLKEQARNYDLFLEWKEKRVKSESKV